MFNTVSVEEFASIAKFYRQIQPAIKADNEEIEYREILIRDKLKYFVHGFWRLKTNRNLIRPCQYRVVSDGCIDIFFDHKNPQESFIMGFCRKYREFEIGNNFDYQGIRFLPSAFPLIFGINAKRLSDQSRDLKELLPTWHYGFRLI